VYIFESTGVCGAEEATKVLCFLHDLNHGLSTKISNLSGVFFEARGFKDSEAEISLSTWGDTSS
jgi:hypothetical protein